MKPVIGIDVSKGESEGDILLERNKPYEKAFRFQHTHDDISRLIVKLEEVEELVGVKPAVVLESTGHSHLGLVNRLVGEFTQFILQPLLHRLYIPLISITVFQCRVFFRSMPLPVSASLYTAQYSHV